MHTLTLQEEIEFVYSGHPTIDDCAGPRISIAVSGGRFRRVEASVMPLATDDDG
jgi:hypothetical protein